MSPLLVQRLVDLYIRGCEEPVCMRVVVKIRHYVRIVRQNRRGYGREGNRAHTHNTRKAYTNKARVWASPNEPLVTKQTNARDKGLHTDTQGKGLLTHMRDTISNAFVKREVHGQTRTLPCYKTREHKQGLHTGDTISNDFVKGEVHGQARTLPCHKLHKHTRK